jgi:hypothetical protein
VVDRLAELELPVTPYNGGEAPIDKDRFVNARAEDYWILRERLDPSRRTRPSGVSRPAPEKAVAFLGVQLAVFGLYMGSKFAPNHIGMPLVRLARAAAMPALAHAAASTSEPNASNLSARASNH